MNQLKKQLICLTALISAGNLFGIAGTTTKIVPRSQSFDAARQMVGWNNPNWGINRYPQDDYYASFNATFAYTKTFRDNRLTQSLFGDAVVCGECDDLAIKISGSAVPDRAWNEWLGDYFGLPRDFQSTVTFKPTISNFLIDFSFYAGLDSWIDGLYFRIHGPFVHTKWNLNARETVTSPGTAANGAYFQGYFSSNAVPITNMNKGFLNYANGCVPTINNDFDSTAEYACLNTICTPDVEGPCGCTSLGNITWQSLCNSRISNDCEDGSLTRNGFGELRAVLGWNFLNDEEEQYHVGLGIYAAAPTGTSIGKQDGCDGDQGRYLFEPIIGNGKHWELGAQVTAHYIFWNSQDDSKSGGIYLEANATHLFAASQIRCFDLDSAGSNSRYMLAQYLESNRNSSPAISTEYNPSGLEFGNVYAPVANITQRAVYSTIAVQGDIAVTATYQSEGFQWDIGYNFWGRTCEDLCIQRCCPVQESSVGNWALKGDQRVYGFALVPPSVTRPPADIVALKIPATDSRATIYSGSNMYNNIDYTPVNPVDAVNAFADNASLDKTNNQNAVWTLPSTPPAAGSAVMYDSNPPIFIQESDFDLTGTRGTSNKAFTNFTWKWCSNETWTPYVTLGGEIEFGATESGCYPIKCKTESSSSCSSTCNPCPSTCNPCATSSNSYPTQACDTTPCVGLPRRAPAPTNCIDCALSQWGIWFKIGTSYN